MARFVHNFSLSLSMSLYVYIYINRERGIEYIHLHRIYMEYVWKCVGYACNMYGICMEYVWIMYQTYGFCMVYVWHVHAICRGYAMCGNVRDMYVICMEYVWNMYGVCMPYSVLSLPRPLFKQQQTPKSEQFEYGLKRVWRIWGHAPLKFFNLQSSNPGLKQI